MARLTLVAVILASSGPFAMAATDAVDFNRDVRPILSDKCFACHGPDAEHAKGGLRLDMADSAYGKLKSGSIAIVPGDPARSALVERIYTDDADDLMPPPDSHKELSDAEKATLKRWIAQGGEYQLPWAYVPPKSAPLPKLKRADWPSNYIDHYILARLEAEGLAPAPDADRVTLIRRVSFDLTGLPPTPAEVEAFVNDTAADAYERVVDRLLASPHFGERMAIWWLDMVRFADTVGYHGDQTHRVYPYRDWVINAFNANLPFDRFTIEQLAGDLLENPTQDQLIATCYNRLLQTSHEGGAQLKEYRAIYMADRVRNVSQVWMGATVGCAQCHNHKFDPYTARDFHTLGAFFADVEDEEHLVNQYGGLNTLPTRRLPEMPVFTGDAKAKLSALDAAIADIDTQIAATRRGAEGKLDELERALHHRIESKPHTVLSIIDDGSAVGGVFDGAITQVTEAAGPVHSGKTSRAQRVEELGQHVLRKIAAPIVVADGDTFYAWVHLDPAHPPKAIMLQFQVNGKDWEHRAVWGGDDISYGRAAKSHPGHQRMGTLPATGQWVQLEVSAAQVGVKANQKITEIAFTQFDGLVHWDDVGVRRSGGGVPSGILAILNKPAPQRSEAEQANLRQHLVDKAPAVVELGERRKAIDAERSQLTGQTYNVMVTRALPTPRVVRILPRGNWLDETGEIVQPAIPQFMGALDTGGRRATRLDLARWLVTPEADGGVGGLTARVQVNRVWQLMMGVGIARVLDDFGGQGEPPVHPELLDRLAVEFVRGGWDIKAMMKTIAMSRTYRQSSLAPTELRERDPDNRLYARQSRPRVPAESVRDTALAISGLLVRDIGGPSVNPYQPPKYYTHLNFPKREYAAHTDARQWRRGVYVHWQRQFLHPMLKAFDATTREECTAQRPASNIPTQALVLLNDPTFVEAARAFAARILAEGGDNDAARIVWAFRQATSRAPEPAETALLAQLLADHRAQFAADRDGAAKLQAVGLTKPPAGADAAELAAWTSVARTILNLNEVYTRN